MKYIMMILCCSAAAVAAIAQPTVYPASAQHERIALLHATIHIGNGQVIEDGTLVFNNGRIEQVGHTVDLKDAKQTNKLNNIWRGLGLHPLLCIFNCRRMHDAVKQFQFFRITKNK